MGGEQHSEHVGNPKTNGYVNGDSRYKVEEHVLGEPRHLRIVTIGAGAAGLNMARHLELYMNNFEHVIYEKNDDVGGTWFENRWAVLCL